MGCTKVRVSGLEGLTYTLYTSMPVLFAGFLADDYCNWQQNGRIPTFVYRGEVALLRKDLKRVNDIKFLGPSVCSI